MSVSFNLLILMADGVECLGELCDCRDKIGACHGLVCEDFDFYRFCDHIEDMCEHNALEVNVSNANARDLLAAMGFYSPDLGGSADADVFVRRAMLLANGRDMAAEVVETGGPGTGEARMIDCGRPEGYSLERGLALMKLAQAGVERGLRIGWS